MSYISKCPHCRNDIVYEKVYFYEKHLHLCSGKNKKSFNDVVVSTNNNQDPTISYEDNNSIMSEETTTSSGIVRKEDYEYDNKASIDFINDESLRSDSEVVDNHDNVFELFYEFHNTSLVHNNTNDSHDFLMHTSSSSGHNNYKSSSSYSSDTNSFDNDENHPIHPFEALSLKFFRDNDIPITLFAEYIKLFQFGLKTNYLPNNIPSYKYLLRKLKQSNRFYRHQYKTETIERYEGISLNVRVFPFIENIKWLLKEKDLMEDSIWNYNSSTTNYAEMNTGYWWKNAEERMRLKTVNAHHDLEHVLIPVIPFIDKTHCSNKGTLNAEPVLISIGNIPLKNRKKHKSWFNLGFIPTKLISGPEKQELKKGTGTRSTITKLYHDALNELFRELLDIQWNDEINHQGIKLYVHGKGFVYAHFELAMIIGDSVGHDQLCCHYQAYSSELQRPMRMCFCSYDDLDNPLIVCKPVIAENIDKIISSCIESIHTNYKKSEARQLAKSLSQELHVSTMSKFNFGGDKEGVFGSTPVESLHALLFGPIKYSLLSLYEYKVEHEMISNIDGRKQIYLKNAFRTAEFERRVRILSKLSKRQSYRHIPRSTYSNGVCSLSGLSAQELIGLSILTIVALPGCIDIESTEKRLSIERGFSELLWLGVSLYESFNCVSIDKHIEMNVLETKVRYYIHNFCEVCGEQRNFISEVGTKLTKLHSLVHLVLSIRKYGVPNNYFGGYLESMMKTFVKYPSQRTRKMSGDPFLEDMSNRWAEFSIIDEYYSTTVLPYIENNKLSKSNQKIESDLEPYECEWGMEHFRFVMNGTKWYTTYKDNNGNNCSCNGIVHPFYELPEKVLHALQTWVENEVPMFFVEDSEPYISCHYNVKFVSEEDEFQSEEAQIFRAHPSYRKEEWFDWLNIEYEDEKNPDNKYDIPTKTFLWMKVCYENDDILDPEFVLGWALKTMPLQNYPYLHGLGYDKLWMNASVYPKNLVRGTAFVLPCVNIDDIEGSHGLTNYAETYLRVDEIHNTSYISIPARSLWCNIGWNTSNFKMFQKKWIRVVSNLTKK